MAVNYSLITAAIQPRYSRDSVRFRTCTSSPDDPFSPVRLLFQLPTSLGLSRPPASSLRAQVPPPLGGRWDQSAGDLARSTRCVEKGYASAIFGTYTWTLGHMLSSDFIFQLRLQNYYWISNGCRINFLPNGAFSTTAAKTKKVGSAPWRGLGAALAYRPYRFYSHEKRLGFRCSRDRSRRLARYTIVFWICSLVVLKAERCLIDWFGSNLGVHWEQE